MTSRFRGGHRTGIDPHRSPRRGACGLRLLFLGDVVGRSGRAVVAQHLPG
jgi:hypothetical protein